MIDVKPSEEEEKTLKINFTEEQKQALEEFIARQNKLLLKAEPVMEVTPDGQQTFIKE